MYQIKLEKFEGPLDLLHSLIESKKLEITEISLAQVADQFLKHLKLTALAMGDMADFLVVAGRLALIKSRALLPFLKLNEEEEKDIASLRDQLAEYQKYRELGKKLGHLDKTSNRLYDRAYLVNQEPIFYFPKKLTPEKISQYLNNLLNAIALPQKIPQARLVEKISLEEKLREIEKKIKEKTEIGFSEVLNSKDPEEKVAVFLSVLELFKRSRIETEQKYNFQEIKLKWKTQEI